MTEEKINSIKKTEVKPAETKKEKTKIIVENKKSEKLKKNEAIVNGKNLSMSIKHATAIANMIRNRNIENAIKELEEVIIYKRAVPMRGEIPHRKGMMSGRYPINASKIILRLLKSLKSNAIANELEIEKFKIFAMANVAPRPYKRFGQGRFKRSHITIKLIPLNKTKENTK